MIDAVARTRDEDSVTTEKRLRTVIANAPVSLFAFDAAGVITLSEGKVLEDLGLKPGQLVGLSMFEVYPDAPDLRPNVQRALAGEAVSFITIAGGLVFEVHFSPYMGSDGEVAGVTAVSHNISKQRQAENELRLVIDTIPALAWTALPDGNAESLNKRWHDYAGITPGAGVMEGWKGSFHPEDLPKVVEKWLEILSSGAAGEVEARMRRFDGEYRWFLIRATPLRDESGKIVRWYGINTDIDDLKRTEADLRRSESILAEGEAISLTGSGSWNLVTGKMTWSAQDCRMLGLNPDEIEPSVELFLQCVHPEDVPRLAPIIEEAMAQRRPYSLEYRVVMPDGSIKHFETAMRPVVKPSGVVEEYIGVSRDVTETKRAEEALRSSERVARGQVEALVQSLDVLATAPAPEQFIVRMLSTIGRLLDAQWVALWLLNESRDSLLLRASVEGDNPDPADQDHPFVRDPSSWKADLSLQELFFTGVPIACEDIDKDERVLPAVREYFKAHGTKKFLRLPTLVGGEVKGFITIRHAAREPYRTSEIELAQALAHQTMLAIQIGQAATLEERNRMARDIHDTLAQGFTALIIQLQAAEDARSRGLEAAVDQHLRSARDLARASLNEARRSVRALRPQALEDASFWDAMKALIQNATAGTTLRTSFSVRGKLREFSPVWQEHFLHIGQEALTNTLKYANASNFETRLSFANDEIRLAFQDDGCGFVTTDPTGGSGLIGMRERVAKIGATLEITSTPGGGTTVAVASARLATRAS